MSFADQPKSERKRIGLTQAGAPARGGARKGAGRKPASTPRKAVTVRLSEPARQRLSDIKHATGRSHSAILEQFLMP